MTNDETGSGKLLRQFLLRAAFEPDEDVRKAFFGQASDEFAELDELFSKAARQAGVAFGKEKPWIPPRSLCLELADWTAWLDEYGAHYSPPWDQIYIAVRFAMPLVATGESGGGAAG